LSFLRRFRLSDEYELLEEEVYEPDEEEVPLLLLLEELALLVSDELEEITELSSSSFSFCAASLAAAAWACSKISFGAFFKNSLIPSVRGPNPILVKKLIA